MFAVLECHTRPNDGSWLAGRQQAVRHEIQKSKLETVSIAEPLQNRQHAQNP